MIMILITIMFTNFSFCGFYWKQNSGAIWKTTIKKAVIRPLRDWKTRSTMQVLHRTIEQHLYGDHYQ